MTSVWASWSSAAVLLVVLLLLGVVVGGFVATRVIGTAGMGWDQLADTLGGVMVGGAGACVIWIVALRTLEPRRRFFLALFAVVAAGGVIAASRVVPVKVRSGSPVAVPPPLVESFSLQLGTDEAATGSSPDAGRLPWRRLRVGSNLALDFVRVDRPGELCLATDGIDSPHGVASLTSLRAILSTMPGTVDCGPPCPGCDDVGLEWYLDQTRFTLQLNAACWYSHPAVQPLRKTVEEIVTTYGAGASCEPAGR